MSIVIGDGRASSSEAVSDEHPAVAADAEAWSRRLTEHLEFDAGKQRMLENLLEGNEELRKQNIAIEMENRQLQHTLDLDARRHRETPKEGSFSDMYDWVVDIQLLSDVSKEVCARQQCDAHARIGPHMCSLIF